MTPRPRLSVSAAAVALGMALAVMPSCRPTAKGLGGQGVAPSAAAAVAAPAPRMQWAVDAVRVFHLTLSSRADVGLVPSRAEFELDAELELWPRGMADDQLELAAALRNVKVRATGTGGATPPDQLTTELGRPFSVFLKQGVVHALALPKGSSSLATGIRRTVASALQFAEGTPDQAGNWTSEEYDATGAYVAEYRPTPEQGKFSKQKLRYSRLTLPPGSLAKVKLDLLPRVVASAGEVVLAGHELRGLTYRETIEANPKVGAAMKSETRLGLSSPRDGSAAPSRDWVDQLRDTVRISAGEPLIGEQHTASLDAARIDGLTFDQALAGLEREATHEAGKVSADDAQQKDHIRQQSRLFSATAALFRQQPATIARATAQVRSRNVASEMLLDALGSAGSDQAQAALVGVVRDRKLPDKTRIHALASLIRTPHPTEPSTDAVLGLTKDPLFGRHAIYGLGTIARHLRESGEVKLSDRCGQVLTDRLGHAATADQRIDLLRGVANSGFVGALGPVRPLLADADPRIRGAAVEAIRLMNSPVVDPLIAERMTHDSLPSVRLSALNAAKTRDPSEVLSNALIDVFGKQDDPHARLKAVELAGRWLSRRPELRAALNDVSEHDAQPRIREAAQQALAPSS